jgi:hypothetical protein
MIYPSLFFINEKIMISNDITIPKKREAAEASFRTR